jgi:hypothetical protein
MFGKPKRLVEPYGPFGHHVPEPVDDVRSHRHPPARRRNSLGITLREDRGTLGDAVLKAKELEVALQLANIASTQPTITSPIRSVDSVAISTRKSGFERDLAKRPTDVDPAVFIAKWLISRPLGPECAIEFQSVCGG